MGLGVSQDITEKRKFLPAAGIVTPKCPAYGLVTVNCAILAPA
jgi:hypothetical protein